MPDKLAPADEFHRRLVGQLASIILEVIVLRADDPDDALQGLDCIYVDMKNHLMKHYRKFDA